MSHASDFVEGYCKFENGIHILLGISRNKENDKTSPDHHRFMRRFTISCKEDIAPRVDDLFAMGNKPNNTYRIYISANERDLTKGLFNFQKRLLDLSLDFARGLNDAQRIVKRLDSVWKTELMQRKNRATKRFMLDIDEDDLVFAEELQDYIHTISKVIMFRPTVSGYAIVFDACDTRELMEKVEGRDVELHRDGMLFVETWKVY